MQENQAPERLRLELLWSLSAGAAMHVPNPCRWREFVQLIFQIIGGDTLALMAED